MLIDGVVLGVEEILILGVTVGVTLMLIEGVIDGVIDGVGVGAHAILSFR